MCIGHLLLNILMSQLLPRSQSRKNMGDGGYFQGRCGVLQPVESRTDEERERGI